MPVICCRNVHVELEKDGAWDRKRKKLGNHELLDKIPKGTALPRSFGATLGYKIHLRAVTDQGKGVILTR